MPTLQKAHRRVRVKASDWGAQACKTSSKSPIVWVNNVGTFWSGVSSFLVEQAHGFTGPTRIKYPTGISFSPLWTIFTSLLEDETDGSLFGSSLSPWRWLEHPSPIASFVGDLLWTVWVIGWLFWNLLYSLNHMCSIFSFSLPILLTGPTEHYRPHPGKKILDGS